jgi:hypothetical protein
VFDRVIFVTEGSRDSSISSTLETLSRLPETSNQCCADDSPLSSTASTRTVVCSSIGREKWRNGPRDTGHVGKMEHNQWQRAKKREYSQT